MKVLIDTNILIDVALERQPHFDTSEEILALAEQHLIEGYVSASTFSDLYYIIRKDKGRNATLQFLKKIVEFCPIASVDHSVITMALASNFSDFEDGIQYSTAIASQLDAIVTRNPSDFVNAIELQIFTPEQLIQSIAL